MGYYIDFMFEEAETPDTERLADLFIESGMKPYRLRSKPDSDGIEHHHLDLDDVKRSGLITLHGDPVYHRRLDRYCRAQCRLPWSKGYDDVVRALGRCVELGEKIGFVPYERNTPVTTEALPDLANAYMHYAKKVAALLGSVVPANENRSC